MVIFAGALLLTSVAFADNSTRPSHVEWRIAASDTTTEFVFNTNNTAMADEVTLPISSGDNLGNILTFDAENTGLPISFTLTTVATGDQFEWLHWSDGNVDVLACVNATNDDWQVEFSAGVHAFGFEIMSVDSGSFDLSLYDESDMLIANKTAATGGEVNRFVGFVSDTKVKRILVNDNNAATDSHFFGNFDFLALPSPYVKTILNQCPSGYWSFNEPIGYATRTNVYARIGPNNANAFSSTSVVAGESSDPALIPPAYRCFSANNTAYSFDGGEGAGINLDLALLSAAEGSVSFWFRKDGTQDPDVMQIMWYAARESGGNGGGSEDEMHVDIQNTGKVRLFIEGFAEISSVILTTSKHYNDNIWHHVAATWSGMSTSLYLDGGSDTDGETITGKPAFAAWSFDARHRFGKPAESIREYSGKADELAVWNRVLSASEVKTQYLSAKPFVGFCFIIR